MNKLFNHNINKFKFLVNGTNRTTITQIQPLFNRSFQNFSTNNNNKNIINNINNKVRIDNKTLNKNNFEFKYENWSNEQKERFFKSAKTSNLIYAIIGINTAVFLYVNSQQEDNYSFQRFIKKNFFLSLDNFQNQPITLITSFFTHSSFGHFIFNMLGLFTIGPMVLNTIGASSFFGLYMLSGLASGIGFLGLQKYYREDAKNYSGFNFFKNNNKYLYSKQRSHQYAIGASGAIYGVMAVFGCLYPKAILSLYGIIPIPAMVAVGGFIAYDLFQEVSGADTGVSHIGHLGGAAYGLLYYFFHLRGRYSR